MLARSLPLVMTWLNKSKEGAEVLRLTSQSVPRSRHMPGHAAASAIVARHAATTSWTATDTRTYAGSMVGLRARTISARCRGHDYPRQKIQSDVKCVCALEPYATGGARSER